jgi:hypothetical protein
MAELTYDDFKNRINIQDLLVDAGYQLNRRDGLRYPSYVRMDSNGKRVRGDKFIVTGNGLCCFQPPEVKNYNVISFIKEHPHLFSEYTPGMNADRLVNLVCNRLLNNPIPERPSIVADRERAQRVFDINDYDRLNFRLNDWDSQKAFYPYFKSRGIKLDTQRDFHNNFFIAIREGKNGKQYANLSFPMQKPSNLGTYVGLEERSRANAEGKTLYKGMAAGTNATEGMWIANLSGEPLDQAKHVYWFESAFDAMAYYQIQKEQLVDTIGGYEDMQSEGSYKGAEEIREFKQELYDLENAVFVSTGGNPSIHQFKGMFAETNHAKHYIGFDRDLAGRTFAINFALTRADKSFYSHIGENGKLVVVDAQNSKNNQEIDLHDFRFEDALKKLGIESVGERPAITDYMKTLRNPDDIFSGDTDYLPYSISSIYGKYETLSEEYHVATTSGYRLCEEDLKVLKENIFSQLEKYREELTKAANEYRERPGQIVYSPCDESYKDWNDQLLDKKMYTNEDIIETAIDGTDGEYREIKDDFEDNQKKEKSEEDSEEHKHHFRR